MRIAIVGSRSFASLKLVEAFVREIPRGVTVVSGGAKGVDQTAAAAARDCGLEVTEHLPDTIGCKERFEFTARYYRRNQAIADDCDLLVAFTAKDSGGTWDTIKRARAAGKPVKVIRGALAVMDTIADDDAPDASATPDADVKPSAAAGREKGRGPFHMKRVALGSFALKLRRYLDVAAWADFINAKDADPHACAAMMLPDFLQFFSEHPPGVVHAITQAPKSRRRSDKLHPMDIVCRAVADELRVPYVELFEPWEKSTRGRHAVHGEIAVKPAARDYVGRVVWVLDDVSTTNRTLKAAVGALQACGMHTHGLCWVLYA